MDLRWHSYRYYPYERALALREIHSLLAADVVAESKIGIRVNASIDEQKITRLVYFSEACDGERSVQTLQAKLESVNGNGLNRQSTRYSTHGLHEYKGKFNPQIVRAILNMLAAPSGARILDPFCGSGTSLVECAHLGMRATGVDFNPLAVFIANAKLSCLHLPATTLGKEMRSTIRRYTGAKVPRASAKCERRAYLESWFEPAVLSDIERLRAAIERGNPSCANSLLSIASNLLREYSLQDPHDLRIRRRKNFTPKETFVEAWKAAVVRFVSRLAEAQEVIGKVPGYGKALLLDSRSTMLGRRGIGKTKFDCAVTSPPYSMALPYIDTQRLSLVWLGLLAPSDILSLEANLIGSREVRGQSKKELVSAMVENRSGLPQEQVDYCRLLLQALSDEDGFRRRAVPMLLYRYFSGMAEAFKSVHACLKVGAPFALVVGRNHTVLSGQRFDIDTPVHLAQIALNCGFVIEEVFPLQTYQRYGYHMNNAINSEDLLILRSI